MVLDVVPNPDLHLAHFHVTRGWGLTNVLAALQAGISLYKRTLGGIVGQPTNFMDRTQVPGMGYYCKNPNVVGLASFEDLCLMLDEMKINIGPIDIDRVLELGKLMERTLGRRLRSESILNGRIPNGPGDEFRRAGQPSLKKKLRETPGHILPEGWPAEAEVPGSMLTRKAGKEE